MYSASHPTTMTRRTRVLRLLAIALTAVFLTAGAAQAGPRDHQAGGFTGPGAAQQGGFTGPGPELITVEKARTLDDDTWVRLRGNITQSLGDKRYTFTDATGSITVEIGKKAWGGQQIAPTDTVEIQGEVDKDWSSTEIDVKRVMKQQ